MKFKFKPQPTVDREATRDEIKKVKAKFEEIENRIEEERKLQAHYEKILPKLEAEMNYIVTYKDPK